MTEAARLVAVVGLGVYAVFVGFDLLTHTSDLVHSLADLTALILIRVAQMAMRG